MEASQHVDEQEQKGGEAATDEEVIVGDAGLQPLSDLDQHDPNKVGPSSAPAPQVQSGVPLAEDRAAGVQPGGAPAARSSEEGDGEKGEKGEGEQPA